MNAQGVSEFVELGAGNVLSGLIKRCVKGKLSARDVKNSPLSSQDTPESLEALAKALSED